METLALRFGGENDQILTVTLNRPDVLNAMNTRMMEELLTLFRQQAYNDGLRCIVVTGAGDKAFSTGGDLKERHGMTNQQWRRQHHLAEDFILAIVDFPVPVISAVEGFAFAGGCELALATDFIIASETASFALKEVTRGIMPGGAGIQNLARAVGLRRAKELVYTGRAIDARTAYEWGLANRVVSAGQSLDTALQVASEIVVAAPMSMRFAKLAINNGSETEFHAAYALDIAAYNVLVGSEDRLEGIAAFNEKRKPKWKNR
jgi:enoyl-CoA hydratase/carnithine racemase